MTRDAVRFHQLHRQVDARRPQPEGDDHRQHGNQEHDDDDDQRFEHGRGIVALIGPRRQEDATARRPGAPGLTRASLADLHRLLQLLRVDVLFETRDARRDREP